MGKNIFGYEEEYINETTSDYCKRDHNMVPTNDRIGDDFWCAVKEGSKMLSDDAEIFKLI